MHGSNRVRLYIVKMAVYVGLRVPSLWNKVLFIANTFTCSNTNLRWKWLKICHIRNSTFKCHWNISWINPIESCIGMYTWHANKTNERMTSYLCICYVTSKLSWFLFCRWERTDKQQPFTYRVTSDYTHHRLHTGAIGSVVLYCHELF